MHSVPPLSESRRLVEAGVRAVCSLLPEQNPGKQVLRPAAYGVPADPVTVVRRLFGAPLRGRAKRQPGWYRGQK